MPGAADGADDRALVNALSTDQSDAIQMPIERLPAVAMIDHDHVAIAIFVPACVNDHTRIHGVDRLASIARDVDTAVVRIGRIIITRKKMVIGGPDERAKPNRTVVYLSASTGAIDAGDR